MKLPNAKHKRKQLSSRVAPKTPDLVEEGAAVHAARCRASHGASSPRLADLARSLSTSHTARGGRWVVIGHTGQPALASPRIVVHRNLLHRGEGNIPGRREIAHVGVEVLGDLAVARKKVCGLQWGSERGRRREMREVSEGAGSDWTRSGERRTGVFSE